MSKPESNIFESTLLGTGGGYGESLVIHLANDNWIVIDSCINPTTKGSLPLEYLENLGVDLKKNVKMIVCTHWHDDHIRGLSKLLEKCESAIFSMAKATDRKKFLRLVGLDDRKRKLESSISSTIEINKCLEIIERRKTTIRQSIEDRLLLTSDENGIKYEVYSLSPSDYIMNQFDIEISSLITEYGSSNRKLILESPNSKSVVIYIKVNELRVLLGADLEVEKDSNQKGWLRILDSSQVLAGKASLFKVSHHGSENGNHERMWTELLLERPITKLTPWNKNGKLPTLDMLNKIHNKSEIALITSTFRNLKNKPKQRDKDITKIIKTMKPSLEEVQFSYGQVNCRSNIFNKNSIWCIDLSGSSKLINTDLFKEYPVS
ncbi:MAG TPA: MBL fold metallo-hydrolase [Saprospiraceae bacterium]|nr:MBL fold metallo-hydrolase [Saprospiraceae bacterium]HPN71455.1 MBL fold metallo-hydrolase [Saprospiraceae bacterium]